MIKNEKFCYFLPRASIMIRYLSLYFAAALRNNYQGAAKDKDIDYWFYYPSHKLLMATR